MINFVLTDKIVVAIAFFICVGLIIKLFGKKILAGLDLKKVEIVNELVEKELRESELQTEVNELLIEEKNAKAMAYSKLEDAKKESEDLIRNATQQAAIRLNEREIQQNKLNIVEEEKICKNMQAASIEAAIGLLHKTLIQKDNGKIQKEVLDKILDEAV